MEVLDEEQQGLQAILSPSSSGRRRRSSASNSPEFEFWNLMRNPNSFTESNLLSADELFSDGVMLPLDQLHISSSDAEPHGPGPEPEIEANGGDAAVSAADDVPALTSSKRWRDIIIFRKHGDAKGTTTTAKKKNGLGSSVKEGKKRESKKGSTKGGGGGAAELNINIWPFSRSRSAGNGGARPRASAAGGGRKVSSAPCSRSNSGGESKTRKWPSSPGRMNGGGVHLGRTSPVWQVRRGGGSSGGAASVQNGGDKGLTKKDGGLEARRKAASAAGASGKRVLSLNVPMCMGYSRSHLSCRSNEGSSVSVAVSSAVGGGGGGGVVAGEGVRGSNMFGIKGLFTKKVY